MKDQPKTDEQKAKAFITAYQKLSIEHGYQIVVTPAWKARDDGTFSLVQQTAVGPLPKED